MLSLVDLRQSRSRAHQTQTEESSRSKHQWSRYRALERHRSMDQLAAYEPAASSRLTERRETPGGVRADEKRAQRDLYGRGLGQTRMVTGDGNSRLCQRPRFLAGGSGTAAQTAWMPGQRDWCGGNPTATFLPPYAGT